MSDAAKKETLSRAKRLEELLVPVLRHQIERRGIEDTGAYNFYNIRVQESYLFRPFEIELAYLLSSSGLAIRRIDEIGSGFGQLMFLLGWSGFKTVGYESHPRRANTALTLRSILSLVDPELTENVCFLKEEFPSVNVSEPEAGSLVLTTNLTATRSKEQVGGVLHAMRRYPLVVSDITRFFGHLPDRSQKSQAMAIFTNAGFEEPELFLDAGAFGQFYLFRNAT